MEESIAGGETSSVYRWRLANHGNMSTSWRRSGAYQSLTDQASFVVPLKSMVSIKLSSARHPPIGLWTRASLMEVFPLEGKLDDDEIPSWNLSLPFRFSISRIMNISFFFSLHPVNAPIALFLNPKSNIYTEIDAYTLSRDDSRLARFGRSKILFSSHWNLN